MNRNLNSSKEFKFLLSTMEMDPIGACEENATDTKILQLYGNSDQHNLKPLLMKKVTPIVLFAIMICSASFLRAQGFVNDLTLFSNTTNYTAINRNNFVVTDAGSDFANYHLSNLKLGSELAKFATGDTSSYDLGTAPTPILGKFTAYRIEYTEPITFKSCLFRKATTRLRAIIVRANTTPADGSAPCILLATGMGGTLENFESGQIVNLADLLMRGYVVMFYETIGSSRKIKHTNLFGGEKDSIAINIAAALIKKPCLKDPNFLQHSVFLNGEAAAKWVTSDLGVNTIQIDKTKVFTYGFSFGSFQSAMLLLAKRSDFSATIKTAYGISPKDEFTNLAVRNTSFTIRGGVILGGGIFKVKDGMTDVLDNTDAQKRWLSIYGKDDFNHIDDGTQEIEGRNSLSARLTAVNVKHFFAPICGAGHTLYGPGTKTEDFFKSESMKNLMLVVNSTNSDALTGTISIDTALTETLNNFKKINTQSYQVASTACKFMQNTLTGSATALDSPDTVQHVKNLGVQTFGSESSWIFHPIQSNCIDLIPE